MTTTNSGLQADLIPLLDHEEWEADLHQVLMCNATLDDGDCEHEQGLNRLRALDAGAGRRQEETVGGELAPPVHGVDVP
eukprot:CAMPEP_0171271978 /NCGR_PEP_ID=MMETSP0790-20130122/61513_1 /TAXON_ID=2925 /ORGANISM="Alexandrium catenella, Strain OF101" /LENGTH=78 /DNA_ID=CAMNT_0011740883 /DNA_START=52 /DNA_END=285 /DNA_ORIENTATION=+